MTIEGVDYAFPPLPTAAALQAAGKHFACRYGGPGSDSKQLTAAELAALKAAGIAVVANAEGVADGLRDGYAAGRSWAQQAEDHFRALGMPADRPIYFSVDCDTTSGNWAALDAAMDGAASVIGRNRVGVYGEYSIIAHFASNRKAVWYWQTYAWSGGRWHDANHIEQYRNGVTIGGADCDLNRAMRTDYGQWGVDMLTQEDIAAVAQAVWEYNAGSRTNVVTAIARLNQLAARTPADLADQLAQIKAAALDDGDVTVALPPAYMAALDELEALLRAVPAAVAAEEAQRLAS